MKVKGLMPNQMTQTALHSTPIVAWTRKQLYVTRLLSAHIWTQLLIVVSIYSHEVSVLFLSIFRPGFGFNRWWSLWSKIEKDRAENNNVNDLWLPVAKEEEEEGGDESGLTLHPFQVIDIDIVTHSM